MRMLTVALLLLWSPGLALAANCKRNGNIVTCDDGRTGIFTGDAIIWVVESATPDAGGKKKKDGEHSEETLTEDPPAEGKQGDL